MKKLLLLLLTIPGVCFSSEYNYNPQDYEYYVAHQLPNGPYQETCHFCEVVNNVLKCLCPSRKGNLKNTSLDLNTNYNNLPYIVNNRGKLQFSSTPEMR